MDISIDETIVKGQMWMFRVLWVIVVTIITVLLSVVIWACFIGKKK